MVHDGDQGDDDNTDDKDDDYTGHSSGGSFCFWSLVKQNQILMGAVLSQKFRSQIFNLLLTNFFFFFVFCLFRAALASYGGSQARGLIRAVAACLQPQPQQRWIQAAFEIYTTTQTNTRSLTPWVRLGIEPMSSWILVGFINPWAMAGTSPNFE